MVVALPLLFFALYLPLIFLPPLWGSSEAREVHVIRSLLSSGSDWLLPLRNGIIPSKPPLFHWIGAIVGALFHSSEPWVGRLVSLCAATGMFALTLHLVELSHASLGKKATSQDLLKASFILLTSYLFVANAGDAKVDMLFSFWITAGTVLFYRKSVLESNTTGSWYLWGFASLAMLTKGPLGPVLCLLMSSVITGWMKGWKEILRSLKKQFWPALLCMGFASMWYLLAFQQGGQAFLDRHLFFENARRFSGADDINMEAPWFYLPSFFRSFFPWSLCFIYAGYHLLKRKIELNREVRVQLLGAVMTLALITFFSIPAGKRHSYILPIVPWSVLFVTLSVSAEKVINFVETRLPLFIGFFSVVFLGVVQAIFQGKILVPHSELEWGIVSFHLGIGGVFSAVFLFSILFIAVYISRSKTCHESGILLRQQCVVAVTFLIFASLFSLGLSVKGYLKGFNRMADKINSVVPQSDNLLVAKDSHDEYFDPVLYYLNRKVEVKETEKNCTGFYLKKLSLKDFNASDTHADTATLLVLQETRNQKKEPGVILELKQCGSVAGASQTTQ